MRFSLYQHSSAALKPPKSIIAVATVDPYQLCLQSEGSAEESEEGSVRSMIMTLTSPEMERPPKVFFSLSLPSLLPEEAVSFPQAILLQKRKTGLEAKISRLKSDLKRIHQSLTQQTAAFPCIRFDDKQLIIATESEKRQSGLRACASSGDGKRHCVIA